MASGLAAMPSAARGGVGIRGKNLSSTRAGKTGLSGSAAGVMMSGSRRNSLRAQLRAKSVRPMRFARGGVMTVEAKHSAVPEAQVRFTGA